MTNLDRTPDPLRDPRYGVAMSASLGLFDTAGWTPPPAGEYAGFDGVGRRRRDYGPRGCAGIVVGAAVFLVALVAVAVLVAVGGA